MKKLLKIGELAKEAGVTVRTLRHYEEMGLLNPQSTDLSSFKLYGEEEIKKLQQILSLKSLGFSLSRIKEAFHKESYDFSEVLIMHQRNLREQISEFQKALHTIETILSRFKKNETISTDHLLTFIREIGKMKSIYTQEQINKLEKRFEHYGSEKIKEVEEAWKALFEKFENAMKKGLDPASPEVQAMAKKAQEYIDLFTGGDKEIEKNLDRAYEVNQESALETWRVEKDVFEYATKARKIYLKK